MQRRAPNDLSAFAACQLQTSSCGAFTFKGRDGAGCCCSWRTRPASGSLPRPAAGEIFAWWVHPGALGSRTSGCAQILDKEGLAYSQKDKLNRPVRSDQTDARTRTPPRMMSTQRRSWHTRFLLQSPARSHASARNMPKSTTQTSRPVLKQGCCVCRNGSCQVVTGSRRAEC